MVQDVVHYRWDVPVTVSEVWSHWTVLNRAVTGYDLTF